MRIEPKNQRFVRSAFLFKHQKSSLKQPNRTELQPETQSGSWNPDPKPNPQVGGEQRTHRPGVQLLGAPGRSRSGPLVEPQDGNQQQQHLLKTDPGRRVTDRMRIRTDQDGPAVLQHRARRRSHGSPPPVLLSDKPEGSRTSERISEADGTGTGFGSHDPPRGLLQRWRLRVRTARAPRAFASPELCRGKASGSRKAGQNQDFDFRTRLPK